MPEDRAMTSGSDPCIRPAGVADVPAILAIYNEVIAHSSAVYALEPFTLADRQAWFAERQARGFPVLVAADGDDVLGFSSFADWRGATNAYRFTIEHSVHVRADRRGQGLGRSLVQALFQPARALGKHVMLGAVDADNAGSIAFHEKLGFERAAHFRETGHKFGRWLDLVFMQAFVDGPGAPR